MSEWIFKRVQLYTDYKRLRCKDTHKLKVEGVKKIFHANNNPKKVEGTTIISVMLVSKRDNASLNLGSAKVENGMDSRNIYDTGVDH